MNQPAHVVKSSILLLALGIAGAAHGGSASTTLRMPYIDGPWWQVAGDPDLGPYTTEHQQPVDFAVWQAADGIWQLWSCIRGTACGGQTRLFHGWEGQQLTDSGWRPLGVVMEAEPKYGETPGGLQAPHVVQTGGIYHMLYGDWENICLATSRDGKQFERYVLPNGTTRLFSEGPGANTRDIMVLQIGDLWYGYYTAFPNRQGAVYCRTSPDLKNWSESTTVAFGGRAGTNPYAAECPHVVARHGRFYLFRTQRYGEEARTSVYSSTDPMNFGINQDRLYFVSELPVAAPEIIHYQGQDYIAALLPSLKGIQIARLGWMVPPEPGQPVFDFSSETERDRWELVDGDLPDIFTQSSRRRFNPPVSHFIGTAELSDGDFDDRVTAVVQSPPFRIDSDWMFAYVSGGIDRHRLYVAMLDAETGEELLRVTPSHQGNTLEEKLVNTSEYVGRTAVLQVVDNSQDGWGHINFGGLYTAAER